VLTHQKKCEKMNSHRAKRIEPPKGINLEEPPPEVAKRKKKGGKIFVVALRRLKKCV